MSRLVPGKAACYHHSCSSWDIWRKKCGQQVSDTAGGRWSRQHRTELDGEEWSVAYAPLGAKRLKSSQSMCHAKMNQHLSITAQPVNSGEPSHVSANSHSHTKNQKCAESGLPNPASVKSTKRFGGLDRMWPVWLLVSCLASMCCLSQNVHTSSVLDVRLIRTDQS